ncbi:MAG: RNA-binding protein, partial [Pseudomonas prosekii]
MEPGLTGAQQVQCPPLFCYGPVMTDPIRLSKRLIELVGCSRRE